MNHKPLTCCSVVVVMALVLAVLPTVEPPAWAQAPAGDPVERVGGSSRVETAVALSARFFDRADTVVLATAGRYPDALAAGPLARAEQAPILLTPPAALPATVAAEIDRLGADRVVVVGEEAAVGTDVVSTLSDAGLEVERLGGPERFATAAAVAARLQAREDVTVHTVARGRGETEDDGFADALTAGTLGVLGEVRPTVLTERDLLPDPSAAVLADQASALVIGGVAAVSAPVASEVDRLVGATTRIAGPNRAATSIAVADQVIGVVGPPREVLVVTGSTFPDSLVAGALTAQLQAPILLVPSNLRDGFRDGEEQPIRFETAAPEVTDFLREWCAEIERATVVGLDAAVSPVVEEAVARLINCAPLEGEFTPGEDPATEPTEPTEEPTTDPAEEPDPTPGGGGVVTPPPPPPGGVVVPNVVGLLQGEGMQRITASSLVPTSGGSRHDASPAGTILEQEPPGGVTVARQTPVEIVVSLGPELGLIPDVRGQTEAQARDTISGAGFTLGQVGEDAFDEDGIDPGEVGRQLPLAGQRALPGTPVDVDLSVGGVNHPPTITSTPTPTHVTGGGPWTYDAAATDPDGDALTFVLQGGPLDDDGDLAASIDPSTGVVTWDAQAEDAGPTDFAVRAEDGRGGQDVQSFTVTVRVPNRPPEPAEDVYTAVIDAVLTVPTDTGVLANDTDPDEDPLSASLLDPPANGTVDLAADGSFTYTPTPATGGEGTFTDIDLTQLSGVTVTATAENGSYPASRLVDGYPASSWYVPSSAGSAGHAITLEFPQPVTPDTLTLLGNRDRFADDGYGVTEVDVQLLDGAGAVLLDLPGQAFDPQVPGDGQDPDLTIDLAAAAGGAPPTGVRTVTIAITATDGRYPGLGEVVLEGDGPILDLGPVMEWDRSGTGNAFRVEATPTTADLDGDGHPEVVFPTFDATLHVVDGRTGQERWTATGVQGQSASAVIADLHASPGMEVAIQRTGDSSVIAVFSAEGDLLDEVDGPDNLGEANMAVADVDGDGVAELVLPAGNRITTAAFDGDDLALEWTSPARGCGNNAYRSNCIPIVADIDLDGVAEVVAGTTIYDGRDGSVEAEGTTPADGWAATGQFDADPEAELVVVAGGQVHLLNHDLTPVWATPTAIPEGGSGGAPTVADFDGDGRPEVGVAGARRYVVLDGDGSVLWALPTDDTSSNRTGSTVFDFDDDGVAEVVYRDENRLFVLAGPDGSIRFQTPMGSTTTVEAPIVADVDADGHAEIVVVSDAAQGLPDGTSRQPGVYVFGGPADNWVRARTIWNQHSYHVTNVGVDGVVPQVESANWLDPALNNYRENEFPAGDRSGLDSFTYTVSDGADSAVGTAHVDLRPEENAPAFTCDPAPVAVVGLPYTSRLCATDPDPGDSLTFAGDAAVEVIVPGTANPWLAGYPDGSTHAGGDRVPENAPVQVRLPLVPGQALTFAATGGTSYTSSCCSSGPDGSGGGGHGAQNGYGGLTTNWNALIGVFTGPEVPADPATPPDSLDFSTAASRNQPVIAPDVEQVFFIGDGLTTDGVVQQIVVPEGATGLHLGSMDGFGWYNNSGQFEVTISAGEDQGGPTVAPGTGLLTWTPGPEDVGEWIYLYAVTDSTGRVTYGLFPIQVVFPATVPSVVGLPQVEASRALSDAGLRTGTITEVHDLDVPAGAVVAQQVPGDTVIAPDTRIDLVVSLGPAPGDEDLDADGFSPNEGDCDDTDPDIHPDADDVLGDGVDSDCDGRDGIPAIDRLEVRPATATARVGERRSLAAVVVYTDGSSQDVTLLADWASDTPGVAAVRSPGSIDALTAGGAGISASYQGVQAAATLTVRAPAPVDATHPTLAISQPAGGSTVSAATDVIGTASDDNMASWTLDLLDAAGATVGRIGQGTTSVVDGVLGTLDPTGRPDGVYTLRLVATDQAGNRIRGELLVRIGAPPGGSTIEALLLNPANPQVIAGDTLAMTATAYYSDGSTVDVAGAGTWGTAHGGIATVDADGVLTGVGPGSTTVRVTYDGMDAIRTVVVYPAAHASSDRTPPTAGITAPTPGTAVTEPVQVVGTATDADLLRWTLTLHDGTDDVAEVAGGDAGVTDDVLGTLDPTLLPNGSYELRLVVTDVTGNTATATAPLTVEGALKVGTFDLSVTDLVVPAAGLPITVTRRYDTRNDRVGDFGAGWELALSRLPVSQDGIPGEGWTLTGGGFAFRLQPTQAHTTTITLPDGTAEVFSFTPTPTASAFVPPLAVTAGFTAHPGTRGRLEVLGNRNLLVLGGVNAPTELVDDLTFGVFQPEGLRYTAADGTRWDLRPDGTVTAITHPNGATITVGPDGIISSAGPSATFERDAVGRITAIVDPSGARQTYTYDANGDLVTHTDPDGVVTRYRYTGRHDLVEVLDPLGRPLARTEYDAQGRVTAITDAEGNRTAFEHDLGARQDVVVNPDGTRTIIGYDERGNITSRTDPLGGVTTHTYDEADNQLTTTDPLGRTTTRTFDAAGNVLTATDPSGAVTTTTYDAAGRVTSTTDPDGLVTTSRYDSRGNLLEERGPGIVPAVHSYDSSGNLRSTTDAAGNVTTHTYDADGNRTSTTDARGATTTTTYDASGEIDSLTDPLGAVTQVDTTARGDLDVVTSPAGDPTDITTNAAGTITEVTAADGTSTSRVVDGLGRDTAVTDAAGNTTTYGYDVAGNLVSVAVPGAAPTTMAYDALGNRTSHTTPDGVVTTWSHDAVGRTTAVTTADGTATIGYDVAGNPVTETAATGEQVQRTWTAAGRPATVTDPAGGVTTYTYDSRGRVTRQTFADGSTLDREYDDADRVVAEVDAAGHRTTFRYDAVGNLVEVIDAGGGVTRATYDLAGNRTSLTDAEGAVTRYRYDALGRQVAEIAPDGGTTTVTYDAVGDPVAVTDPAGRTTTTTYDAAGRPVEATRPDGSTTTMTWTADGLVASATDAGGTVAYAYDAARRLASITQPDGASLAYTYDDVGRLASMTADTGTASRTTTYGYDAAGRMTSVTADGRTTTYAYDRDRLVTITRPGGITTALAHDPLGRLVDIDHASPTAALAIDITRDLRGDPTAVVRDDGVSSTFSHDAMRRITEEVHDVGGTQTRHAYTHDLVGNRLTDTTAGGTTTASYDDAHRLTSSGPTSYTYDALGRQTSASGPTGSQLLAWDSRDRLTSVTMPDGSTVAFAHAPTGERLGAGGTRRLVDPLSPTGYAEVVAEYDPTDGTALAWFTYGAGLAEQDVGGVVSYPLLGHDGSVVGLADAAGAITTTATDAFGQVLAGAAVLATPYGLHGQRLEASGLYHMRARDYRPETGRFTSVEPLEPDPEQPVTLHPYKFSLDNPQSFVDPSGELGLTAEIAVAAAINGVVSAAIAAAFEYFQTGEVTIANVLTSGIIGAIFGGAGAALSNAVTSAAARQIAANQTRTFLVKTITTYPRLVLGFVRAIAATGAVIAGDVVNQVKDPGGDHLKPWWGYAVIFLTFWGLEAGFAGGLHQAYLNELRKRMAAKGVVVSASRDIETAFVKSIGRGGTFSAWETALRELDNHAFGLTLGGRGLVKAVIKFVRDNAQGFINAFIQATEGSATAR